MASPAHRGIDALAHRPVRSLESQPTPEMSHNPLMSPLDAIGRPLRNLRLSVTDRCNLRCEYCMPEKDYVWLPREDLLQFEEISTLVDVFVELGVDRLRITGGEPLLRRDLPSLIKMVAAKPGLADLAMTTNGILLADQIEEPARRRYPPRHGEPRHAEARSVHRTGPLRRTGPGESRASPRRTVSTAD